MPNIFRIVVTILLAIIAFAVGKYLVTTLGTSSRGFIILAVIIFYMIWWRQHRRSQE